MLQHVAAHLGSPGAAPEACFVADVEEQQSKWLGTLPPRAVATADYPCSAERSSELSPEEAEHFREFGCEERPLNL